MGRVAKYKKVKSIDPFSKKNGGRVDLANVGVWGLGDNGRKAKKRSRRAEMMRSKKKRRKSDQDGFDLPPSQKDEFDLNDLVGSIRKEKAPNPIKDDLISVNRVTVGGNVATIPKTDEDEKKAARLLNVKDQVKKEQETKQKISQGRMEGESKRAYARRTKTETREIIKRSSEVNTEKKQKKKEFLKNKKKNKKKGGANFDISNDTDTRSDYGNGHSIAAEDKSEPQVDEVRFGEQAERPPIFRQLPRGAKAKQNKEKQASKKGMTNEEVEAEKSAMEMMRRRIQAQYAAIKLKRRRNGEFHL